MTPIESKLIEFARWAIQEHRSELGDLDGSSIQEKLLELGLLTRIMATEPCGEQCRCREYYGEFPALCLMLEKGVME